MRGIRKTVHMSPSSPETMQNTKNMSMATSKPLTTYDVLGNTPRLKPKMIGNTRNITQAYSTML